MKIMQSPMKVLGLTLIISVVMGFIMNWFKVNSGITKQVSTWT